MSAIATAPIPPTTIAPASTRANVVVQNKVAIPGWVCDLASYRTWAQSADYPETGWVSFLDGDIFVDPDMEEFLSHNRVKQAFNGMFGMLLMNEPPGCFVPDRMLLANETANLSTEPDGLFYLWATMQSGRLRLVPGKKAGYMQLEGTPDVVLEIVSEGSVSKDVVTLRDLYWKSKIPEYWVVDARKDAIQFDILRHADDGYQPTAIDDGWVRSEILGRSFRIERTADPLGYAQFVVHIKPEIGSNP